MDLVSDQDFTSWGWKERGACAAAVRKGEANPEEWFPAYEKSVPLDIKKVCNGCGVRIECLTAAIYCNEPVGIWGGKPIREIRKMRRKINAALRERKRRET